MANRWQIRMKNKDENCREGEALGAALGMGSGEGSDLSFVILAFSSCFLILFEMKGEDERKIALLEGRKLREGICPHATENTAVCVEKSNTHPPILTSINVP